MVDLNKTNMFNKNVISNLKKELDGEKVGRIFKINEK